MAGESTPVLALVDSVLELGTAIVTRMNLKDKQKYIDRARQAKLDFLAEDGKPDGERNDRYLEDLEEKLMVETTTLNSAIAAGVLSGDQK